MIDAEDANWSDVARFRCESIAEPRPKLSWLMPSPSGMFSAGATVCSLGDFSDVAVL